MNMNEFERKFDAKFHYRKDRSNRARPMAQNREIKDVTMTWEQQNFCTYMNQPQNSPKEFVVYLERKGADVCVAEVRGIDFSLKRSYKRYPAQHQFEEINGVLPIKGSWSTCSWFKGNGYYVITWRFAPSIKGDLCPVELDPHGYAAPFTAEQMVKAIRNAKFATPSFSADETSGLYDTLAKQLQRAGDEIFIYELLQNASDKPVDKNSLVDIRIQIVPAREVNGKRRDGYLSFCHTGSCFDPQDVAAICSANQKSKTDVGKIGYKGIGFKTVFHYSKRVEIRSGDFGFAFDEKTLSERPDIPWMTTPGWVHPNTNGNYRVDIRLFPRDPDLKLSNGEGSYRSLLEKLFKDERALLFIPRINKLELCIDGRRKVCSPSGGRWCRSHQYEEVLSQELRTRIAFEIDNKKSASRIPPKYAKMDRAVSMFACRVEGRKLIPEDVNSSYLYCYLPASAAHWGLPFLMNTDMVPDGNRSNIEYAIAENKDFSKIAGRAFYKWICDLIASAQYDYDTIFQLIPDFDDCTKNRVDEKPFIEAFQAGFEESLCPKFKIPDEFGRMVDAESVSVDIIGALKILGPSLAKEICGTAIPHESLWNCHAFTRFVKRYCAKLGVKLFDWEELKLACTGVQAQEWLKTPDANSKFIEFLLDKSVIEKFTDIPIFLENRGSMGRACDLYSYGKDIQNVEKYLPRFVHHARYLSSEVTYHDKLKDVKFKDFGPRTFLVENVLSQAAIKETCEALKEIEIAKGFWSFIAHYRMWNGKERFADDYALLGGLPFVTETGDVCESFASDEFSVYIADDNGDPKILGYEWFKSRVRFVNHKYFEGENGAEIKDFLTSRLFTGAKRLVGKVELEDVVVGVFDRFKEKILADVRAARSDMGVYDFLSNCVEQKCNITKLLEDQIVHWPVENVAGELIERDGKSVWYYNERLVDLLCNGWIKGDEFVVLSQKYQEQRALFNVLGAKDFESEGFGEFFRKEICCHLNISCTDDFVAFHKYMQAQVSSNELVNDAQLDTLKNTPVIVHTKDGACRLDGCEGVLICQKPIDVPLEISEGRLPENAKILDPRLCNSVEMVKYWHEKLGCQILDDEVRLGKAIEAYMERQRLVPNGVSVDEEFKRRHVDFVRSVICQEVEPSRLKDVKLIGFNGCLAAPKELVLSEVYNPKCHFQKYGCGLNYVSECYCEEFNPEKVAEFLRALGVRDEFREQDVGLLSNKDFCKYFWTEYLPGDKSRQTSLKGCLPRVKSSLWILDNKGEARALANVYSPKLAEFARDIDGVLFADEIFQIYKSDQAYCELIDGLGLRERLSVVDSVAWLGKSKFDDKRRGQVLCWIYELYNEGDRDLCSAYAESEEAVWLNGEGRSEKLRDLYFLADDKIERAGALKTHSRVLKLDAYGGKSIRKKCVGALQKMTGRKAIDDTLLTQSIKLSEPGEDQSNQIRKELEMKLLAYSVQRDGEEWHVDKDGLNALSFIRRDWIAFEYESLQEKNETYYFADGKFNYVNGWLDNLVFGDLVGDLIKVLKLACDEAFLKRVLNFKSDDVCKMIASAMKSLPEDCQVRLGLQLKELGIAEKVKRLVTEKRDEPLAGDNALGDQLNEGGVKSEGATSDDNVVPAAPIENEDRSDETAEQETEESMGVEKDAANENDEDRLRQAAEHVKIEDRGEGRERFDFTDDEITDYGNLWRNDGLSPEAMADQNRVTTFRLFRKLKEEGLEPELEERDFNRTFDVHASGGTDIKTKSGMIVHVASAFRGVAYISPFYWRGVVHGKCVVCAVYGHMRDDFRFFRAECDFLACMNNDLAIIRIDGPERVAQVSRFFDCDRDLGFVQNVLTDSAFKVYSLIRVKSKTDMGEAFDRGKFAWSEASRQGVNDDDYGWD